MKQQQLQRKREDRRQARVRWKQLLEGKRIALIAMSGRDHAISGLQFSDGSGLLMQVVDGKLTTTYTRGITELATIEVAP